jgi:peptidoglycan/LPS O-acetylase OafA/YrhL
MSEDLLKAQNPSYSARELIPPLVVVLLGVMVLSSVAMLEARWQAHEAWAKALWFPEIVLEEEGAMEIQVRRRP